MHLKLNPDGMSRALNLLDIRCDIANRDDQDSVQYEYQFEYQYEYGQGVRQGACPLVRYVSERTTSHHTSTILRYEYEYAIAHK